MEDNQNMKTCPKDCLKCHPNQRLYCAAFMSRTVLERIDEVHGRLERLEDKMKRLDHEEKSVFNPMEEEKTQEAAV